MHLTIALEDDRVVSVDVDSGETVSTLKAIAEAETGVPAEEQQISFDGKVLADSATLSASGVGEGELLMLARVGVGGQPGAAGGTPETHPMAIRPDGTVVNPTAMLEALRADPQAMAQLAAKAPPIHEAVRAGDTATVAEFFRKEHLARQRHAEQERQAEADLWNADPFDMEAQARIAERIRQEQISHNYDLAMEHNPESFVQVDMLFVNMHVNKHNVAAFIDSGAQMTIMGLATAERLGLAYLIDKRAAGIARGVGSGKIVGRIHQAMMQVGDQFIACSLSVLESNDINFIFGLDMLRRHQCNIDLKSNVLRFTNLDVSLPFLQPSQLPEDAKGGLFDSAEAAKQKSAEPSDAGPSTSAAGAGPSSDAAAAAGAAAAARARAAAGNLTPAALTPAAIAPPAAAAPPVSQPAPAAAQPLGGGGGGGASESGSASEEGIQKLVALGFPQQQAAEALQVCGGNVDSAASLLFGGF